MKSYWNSIRLKCNDCCLHKNKGRYLEARKERLDNNKSTESTPGTAAKGCPGYVGGGERGRRLLQTFLARELRELLWFSATCFVVFLTEFPEHHCPHLFYCSFLPSFPAGPSPSHLVQHSCPLQARKNFSTLCVFEVLLSRFLYEHTS